MKDKIDYTKSIRITKDIWFYPNKKSFDFVVWTRGKNRECIEFRLIHSKIKKFLSI